MDTSWWIAYAFVALGFAAADLPERLGAYLMWPDVSADDHAFVRWQRPLYLFEGLFMSALWPLGLLWATICQTRALRLHATERAHALEAPPSACARCGESGTVVPDASLVRYTFDDAGGRWVEGYTLCRGCFNAVRDEALPPEAAHGPVKLAAEVPISVARVEDR